MSLAACHQAGASTNVIAITGSDAPLGGDAVYGEVGTPQLNDAGQLAFYSEFTGTGITTANGSALWRWDHGASSPVQILRAGDTAPGAIGTSFAPLDNYTFNFSLNAAGDIAFATQLVGPDITGSTNHSGIWQHTSDALGLIARAGDPAPGITDATYGYISYFRQNNEGVVAYSPSFIPPGGEDFDENAIWLGNTAVQELFLQGGDPAPGDAPDTVFWRPSVSAINDAGRLAIYANLEGSGSATRGLWTTAAGSVEKVFARLDPAPGGGSFSNFNSPVFNNHGDMAFLGSVTTSKYTSHLWMQRAGTLALVVKETNPVPGIDGATFVKMNEVCLNQVGQLLFTGSITGPDIETTTDEGIWLHEVGGTRLIFQTGGEAPGAGGAVFDQLKYDKEPAFNDAGQIVFQAQLAGAGVTGLNNSGLWITDGIDLIQIARTGESIGGHAVRTLYYTGRTNNQTGGLNNLGQFAYSMSFDNFTSSAALLYTPDLHWRGTAGDGRWENKNNWTLSIEPAHVHPVVLAPDGDDLVLTGPSSDTTIGELTIGGGTGAVQLELQIGTTLTVIGDIDISPLNTTLGLRLAGLLQAGTYTLLQNTDGTLTGTFQNIHDLGVYDDLIGVQYSQNAITLTLDRDMIAGDLDLDGFVGIADLNIVLSAWNQNVPPGDALSGDLNGDGFVGIADLNTVLGNWNAGTPPTTVTPTIPEPATVTIMALAMGLLPRRSQ